MRRLSRLVVPLLVLLATSVPVTAAPEEPSAPTEDRAQDPDEALLSRLSAELETLLGEDFDSVVVARTASESADEAVELGWEERVNGWMGTVNGWIAAAFFYEIAASSLDDIEAIGTIDGAEDLPALVAALRSAAESDGFSLGRASVTLTLPALDDAEGVATIGAKKGGVALAVLWLILGATFFTLRMGFIQLRAFGHAIQITRGKYDNPDDEGEVSHFQALTAALSATVGLGNIAGVAIAVSLGGPGATFWMIVAGLLGMASKFTECSLGQMYRQTRPDGSVMGGAMYYLSNGLKEMKLGPLGMVLAVFFAILCMGGSLAGGNSFQVSQSLGAIRETFPFLGEHPWVYGLVMTVLVGVVILGGIRRIAATAEKIVPFMCGIYVLACLYVLGTNAGAIPGAFGSILSGAFTPEAGFGGAVGVLIMGFKRAAFSNEAGIGSAAIAHSAARTPYAVREGIVALLEPFIDTVVVCTMTALVIVITGAYSNPEYADLVAANDGAALTSRAMHDAIGAWFPYVLSVAVVLFAYSTMISWSYYGERCWTWLFGDRSSIIYKLIFLVFVFLGSIISARNVLEFGDLMILGMAFPNILGVLLLSGKVKRALDEYMSKLAKDEFETYD